MTPSNIRFDVDSMYSGAIYVGAIDPYELVEGFERGKAEAISKLETVISIFTEKLEGLGDANAVEDACKALDGLVKVQER
jgi:hypothetical protein